MPDTRATAVARRTAAMSTTSPAAKANARLGIDSTWQ
jgi:hypothetical protein